MKKIFYYVVTLFVLSSCGCEDVVSSRVDIIPRPQFVECGSGEFVVEESISFVTEEESLRPIADIFAVVLEPVIGFKIPTNGSGEHGNITLDLDSSLAEEEYRLIVTKCGISVVGGTPKGVIYGLQSLRQIINKNGQEFSVSAVEVEDKPYFAYRGTMLDVARHYFSVGDIKRFIDMLSLHKINTFHWHLTEDQGWRIEIKKYPRLTEVGSIRKETLVGHLNSSAKYDGEPYGGFYTQDEVREVVKYASERYITIIPEIEMPGHAVGALTAYPWLGCTGGPYEVWTRWGISKDVFCAGKETTFNFIQDVLSEVIELFPSKYIHIGGDECPKDRWRECSYCQKRIGKENLKNEYELQSYFINRIEKWLKIHDRAIIGWDEILQGDVSKTATVMAWTSDQAGAKAAQAGHSVIMTPKWYCYLDYSQTSNPELNGEPIGQSRYLSLRQVYRLDPYNQLRVEEQKFVLGVQANIWTEYMPEFKNVEYMALPRLAAVAEIGWSYDDKSYDEFLGRLTNLRRVYDQCGYNYSTFAFDGVE